MLRFVRALSVPIWQRSFVVRLMRGEHVKNDSGELVGGRSNGFHLSSLDNPVESGTLDVLQRMQSGRLKVFPSLSQYLDERRLYRRDERDQIVKERDNLQNALRCLVNGISRMRTKPKPAQPWSRPSRDNLGSLGWMA